MPKVDVAREFKPLGSLSEAWIESFSGYFPPVPVSRITRVRSPLGKEMD